MAASPKDIVAKIEEQLNQINGLMAKVEPFYENREAYFPNSLDPYERQCYRGLGRTFVQLKNDNKYLLTLKAQIENMQKLPEGHPLKKDLADLISKHEKLIDKNAVNIKKFNEVWPAWKDTEDKWRMKKTKFLGGIFGRSSDSEVSFPQYKSPIVRKEDHEIRDESYSLLSPIKQEANALVNSLTNYEARIKELGEPAGFLPISAAEKAKFKSLVEPEKLKADPHLGRVLVEPNFVEYTNQKMEFEKIIEGYKKQETELIERNIAANKKLFEKTFEARIQKIEEDIKQNKDYYTPKTFEGLERELKILKDFQKVGKESSMSNMEKSYKYLRHKDIIEKLEKLHVEISKDPDFAKEKDTRIEYTSGYKLEQHSYYDTTGKLPLPDSIMTKTNDRELAAAKAAAQKIAQNNDNRTKLRKDIYKTMSETNGLIHALHLELNTKYLGGESDYKGNDVVNNRILRSIASLKEDVKFLNSLVGFSDQMPSSPEGTNKVLEKFNAFKTHIAQIKSDREALESAIPVWKKKEEDELANTTTSTFLKKRQTTKDYENHIKAFPIHLGSQRILEPPKNFNETQEREIKVAQELDAKFELLQKDILLLEPSRASLRNPNLSSNLSRLELNVIGEYDGDKFQDYKKSVRSCREQIQVFERDLAALKKLTKAELTIDQKTKELIAQINTASQEINYVSNVLSRYLDEENFLEKAKGKIQDSIKEGMRIAQSEQENLKKLKEEILNASKDPLMHAELTTKWNIYQQKIQKIKQNAKDTNSSIYRWAREEGQLRTEIKKTPWNPKELLTKYEQHFGTFPKYKNTDLSESLIPAKPAVDKPKESAEPQTAALVANDPAPLAPTIEAAVADPKPVTLQARLKSAGGGLGMQRQDATDVSLNPDQSAQSAGKSVPSMRSLASNTILSEIIENPIVAFGTVKDEKTFQDNTKLLCEKMSNKEGMTETQKALYQGVTVVEPIDPTFKSAVFNIPHDTGQGSNKLSRAVYGDKSMVTLTNPPIPGDSAIYIMLDANKDLCPMVMKKAAGAENLIKVYEAAKLAGIEVNLEGPALEQVKDNAHFKMLQSLEGDSLKAFKEHVKSLPDRMLGSPLSPEAQQKIAATVEDQNLTFESRSTTTPRQ